MRLTTADSFQTVAFFLASINRTALPRQKPDGIFAAYSEKIDGKWSRVKRTLASKSFGAKVIDDIFLANFPHPTSGIQSCEAGTKEPPTTFFSRRTRRNNHRIFLRFAALAGTKTTASVVFHLETTDATMLEFRLATWQQINTVVSEWQ